MTEHTVLTTREVAAALRVDRDTVIRWLNEGALQGFKLPGGDWRVHQTELERIMTPQPAPAAAAQK